MGYPSRFVRQVLACACMGLVLASYAHAEVPLTEFLQTILDSLKDLGDEHYLERTRNIFTGTYPEDETWLLRSSMAREALTWYYALYLIAPNDEPLDFIWFWLHSQSWKNPPRCVAIMEYIRTGDIERVVSRLPESLLEPYQLGRYPIDAVIVQAVWLQWLDLARSGAFPQPSPAGEAFRELTAQLLNTFCGRIP